MNDFT